MTFAINGVDLHFEVTGRGEPLLWLHGAMGCGTDWRYVFAEPPAGFQVIAPDLRGHGASTNPSGQFTCRQCALDVQALLRHLGLPRVKAIGLSGGGIVLLHLATLAPAVVESMVVVSAPPSFLEQARRIQREFSEAFLSNAEKVRLRQCHVGGETQIEALVAMVRAFADDYEDVNFDAASLSTIAAETLIVFRDRDPLYPVSQAFDLHAAIPRSFLWVVPNGGHGPVFREAAPQFATTALAFLRGEWRV